MIWTSVLAGCFAFASLYFLGKKHPIGWVLSIGSQACWIGTGLTTGDWTLAAISAVYGALNYRNWIKWKAEATA